MARAKKKTRSKKTRVPTKKEVTTANKSGCRAREKLASKYGLSGSAARAVGLGPSCVRKTRRRR